MANKVRAKTTPAVIPTAISTSVTSYVEQMAPVQRVSFLNQAEYFEITYQPALAQSEQPQEDEVVGTFPPDGGDADEGKHHDDGEGEGDPEQGRVFLGEFCHRGDEEEPDEAHCDNKLHSEDGVHLQMRIKV